MVLGLSAGAKADISQWLESRSYRAPVLNNPSPTSQPCGCQRGPALVPATYSETLLKIKRSMQLVLVEPPAEPTAAEFRLRGLCLLMLIVVERARQAECSNRADGS